MDVHEHSNIKLALEKAQAEARLAQAAAPDRRNEDWRFGKPHIYAKELIQRLEDSSIPNEGSIHIQAPEEMLAGMDGDLREQELLMSSLGSDRLHALHLSRFGKGVSLFLDRSVEEPIIITYETSGLFTPTTSVVAAPGVRARIVERHRVHGTGVLFAMRDLIAGEGAQLRIELESIGDGTDARAINITNLSAMEEARIRQLSTYHGLAWAREETIAETLQAHSEILLYSANRLVEGQVLDQHTRQRHPVGGAHSNLLYKNVLDGRSTAIFAGNIRVEPSAHQTDAYQANRNMLLSKHATVHSLPGLEILADHVRCSHGSASAPMDEEQLFYLRSRGIPQHEAQLLVATGFLADVRERFAASDEHP